MRHLPQAFSAPRDTLARRQRILPAFRQPGTTLLGAGPSAAAHPHARRCALGTPGSPRVPLTRRLGRGPQPAPAQPRRRRGPRRSACRGRAALRNFAASPRPLCSPSKWRGPRDRPGLNLNCSARAPARLPTPTRAAARWGPRVRRASRLRAGWAGDPSPPRPGRRVAPPQRAPLRVGDPGFGGRAASLAGGPHQLQARLRRWEISRPFRARFAPRAKGAAPAICMSAGTGGRPVRGTSGADRQAGAGVGTLRRNGRTPRHTADSRKRRAAASGSSRRSLPCGACSRRFCPGARRR
jgi:hypothetical protein